MRGAFTSLRQDYITRDRCQNRHWMSLILSAAAGFHGGISRSSNFLPCVSPTAGRRQGTTSNV
jgi:hypothetical protein